MGDQELMHGARDKATSGWGLRRAGVAAVVAVLALAVVAVGQAVLGRPRPAVPAPQVATAMAPVTRGTVTQRIQIAGVLGFDGTHQVAHQGRAGILTAAAQPGAVVRRGGVLYRVDNQPVRLLFGTVPAYRDLAAGMPDGPDVHQLEQNLAALRLDPGRVDQRFTGATAAAIRRWQARWGLPAWRRTGALPLGAVVFAPVALRIGQVPAVVGTSVAPDAPVLAATSTRRVVTAQLPADRQRLVHTGDKVRMTVSGASAPVSGTVVRVGRVAATPETDRGGVDGGANGGSQPATVTVTVRADFPAGGPDLDRAPAQVAITTASHRDVLLVPVVALLPAPGDGYQVRLASGGHVRVRPGLFDSTAGTVEVRGELTVGQLVQVPAP
jgi:peptidoglycan hydrolase-like protein with peptidoglycan-binding domain